VDKPHRGGVVDGLGNGDNDRLGTFSPQIIDDNVDPRRELLFQRRTEYLPELKPFARR
jgi:hypothetical protein